MSGPLLPPPTGTAVDPISVTTEDQALTTAGTSLLPSVSAAESTAKEMTEVNAQPPDLGTAIGGQDSNKIGPLDDSALGDPPPPDAPMVVQIYQKLNELFGQGDGEIFQMEFPARLLEQGNYDYVGSNTLNAQQIKPPPVQEAEFRLANGTYTLSNLIGGPSGGSLAEAYHQLIFQLLPANIHGVSTDNESKILQDQESICQWLMEEVQNFEPPTRDILSIIPNTLKLPPVPAAYNAKEKDDTQLKSLRDTQLTPKIPRIDLYQKLLDLYESERLRWEQFKISARPADDAPVTQYFDYDRLLTSYAPAIDAKLEAIWAMLLVRGQYHRIRKYLGMVDIESASESLQRAKENMRASVSRSIDDTEDVYPVVMTPANWATYLSTAFKPEDLLQNENTVRMQLLQAEKERASLIRRKNNLLAGSQDIKILEKAEIDARKALSNAQTTLAAGYSERALSAIQMYFDTVTKAANDKAQAVLNLTQGSKDQLDKTLATFNSPPLKPEQWEKLKNMQSECFKQQEAAQLAGEAYSRAQLAASMARGKDAAITIATLEDQIQSLELDIEFYKKSLAGSDNPTGAELNKVDKDGKVVSNPTKPPEIGADGKPNPKYNGRVDDTPKIPEQTSGASIWQEIVLTCKKTTKTGESSLSASVSHSDWSVGLFFGSASGSKSSSESHGKNSHSSKDTDIKIGMRVMKVSIDRPWMNTQLLNQTREFFHYNATPISHGSPSDVKKWLSSVSDSNKTELDKASNCLLPSWTSGFIVAKDVHIIMHSESEWSADETNDMQSSANSGGGFLCFSCSKSESSSAHDSKTAFTSNNNTLSIKIPAPQVIGWITHLAPKDECKADYASLPQNELKLKNNSLQSTSMEAQTTRVEAVKPAVDGFAAHTGLNVAAPKPEIKATSTQINSTSTAEKGFVDGFAARGRMPFTPPLTPPAA